MSYDGAESSDEDVKPGKRSAALTIFSSSEDETPLKKHYKKNFFINDEAEELSSEENSTEIESENSGPESVESFSSTDGLHKNQVTININIYKRAILSICSLAERCRP